MCLLVTSQLPVCLQKGNSMARLLLCNSFSFIVRVFRSLIQLVYMFVMCVSLEHLLAIESFLLSPTLPYLFPFSLSPQVAGDGSSHGGALLFIGLKMVSHTILLVSLREGALYLVHTSKNMCLNYSAVLTHTHTHTNHLQPLLFMWLGVVLLTCVSWLCGICCT